MAAAWTGSTLPLSPRFRFAPRMANQVSGIFLWLEGTCRVCTDPAHYLARPPGGSTCYSISRSDAIRTECARTGKVYDRKAILSTEIHILMGHRTPVLMCDAASVSV